MTRRQRRVRRQLAAAIVELREARRFVGMRRFEAAEAEIGDALVFIGRALRSIHRRVPR